MKLKTLITTVITCVTVQIMAAQGLADQEKQAPLPFVLNGYTRGTLYLGEKDMSGSADLKSGYGELGLKISGQVTETGNFYSDIRFRSGYEYNDFIAETDIREAYVSLYPGKLELRLGKQIISWGRADGFNPTNNLTPRNFFVRSPQADDMDMGNFLLSGKYNLSPRLRIEGVWVPKYKYSIYRFDLFRMPDYISFSEYPLPDARLKNSSLAARLEFLFDSFDGSVSWFSGIDPMPGIQPGTLPVPPFETFQLELFSRAYRQNSLGADLAFAVGNFNIRAEGAYRMIHKDDRNAVYAPAEDLRFVAGVDRSFGNARLLIQYMGQYVFDYQPMPVLGGMPDIDPVMLTDPAVLAQLGGQLYKELSGFNRIIHGQTEEFSHSVLIRPSLTMLYETLELELAGIVNFSTEEWNLVPKMTYMFNDNIKISLGGQYFDGPEHTAYDLVAPVFNGMFAELRYSF
jgi:hypothetical protein